MKYYKTVKKYTFLILLWTFSQKSFAENTGNFFTDFKENITEAALIDLTVSNTGLGELQSVLILLFTIAIASGFLFFLYGIYRFASYGKNNDPNYLKTAIINILVGSALLSITAFYNIIGNTISPKFTLSGRTIFNVESKLSGFGATSTGALPFVLPDTTGKILIGFVYTIGFFSFIRGLFIFRKIGQTQSATFGAGMTHLIAGVIAMNILDFGCIVGTTLDLDWMCTS